MESEKGPPSKNQQVIEEFRANGGKVGGRYEGRNILLLHTIGARTGQLRVKPLVYMPVGPHFAVFASKGGSPTHPDWYHNLMAHPMAEVEVGTETIAVTARVADGVEREPIWTAQKQDNPVFADYEQKTPRQIPVIILERVS